MRVIITTSALKERLMAHKWVSKLGWDWYLVCRTGDEYSRLRKMGFSGKRIIVIHTKDAGQSTIAYMRQAIDDSLVNQGEWYLTVDDNVTHVSGTPYCDSPPKFSWQTDYREVFGHHLSPHDITCYVNRLIYLCESKPTSFGGFAIERNPFFRKNHFQHYGYVRTQMAVIKAGDIPFRPEMGMFEDYVKSVETVVERGCIVIDRWAKPEKQEFQPGGIGSFEERRPQLEAACRLLMTKYPGLLKYNKGQLHSLTFAKKTKATIDRWRENFHARANL